MKFNYVFFYKQPKKKKKKKRKKQQQQQQPGWNWPKTKQLAKQPPRLKEKS